MTEGQYYEYLQAAILEMAQEAGCTSEMVEYSILINNLN